MLGALPIIPLIYPSELRMSFEARALLPDTFNSLYLQASRWWRQIFSGKKKLDQVFRPHTKLHQNLEGLSLISASSCSAGFGKLSVTQNLGHALPYLRYPDKPRVLWIDAICVNQKDLVERSKQVQRMAELFTRAARVVVWVGEESHNSKVAMKTLYMVSTKIKFDWGLCRLSLASEDPNDAHVRIEQFFSPHPVL